MVEQSGGWAMPGPEDFSLAVPPPEMPEITVKRGGIRWPMFSTRVHVVSRRNGFLWRTRWYVDVWETRGNRGLRTRLGPFSREVALSVKKAFHNMTTMHNDMHAEEADRWSRS